MNTVLTKVKECYAKSTEETNVAYFLLRFFFGFAFITHGFPKITGGPETWAKVGQAMPNFGMEALTVFWGFMAAFAECGGGTALLLGLATPVFAFLIFFTMSVAGFIVHAPDPFKKKELALIYFFIALMFMVKGGGKYSLDRLIAGKITRQGRAPTQERD